MVCVLISKMLFAEPWNPSQGWKPLPHHLSKEQLWQEIKKEAKHDAVSNAGVCGILHAVSICRTVCNHVHPTAAQGSIYGSRCEGKYWQPGWFLHLSYAALSLPSL